jgi:peroxiredoxin
MFSTLCLVSCALSLGQPRDYNGVALAPRLFPGLELVYSGTHKEQVLIPGVEFQKTYALENTVFVVDEAKDHWDVAFQTALSLRLQNGTVHRDRAGAKPSSVRLEMTRISKRGRLQTPGGGPLHIPLDGPATVETGAIVEFPVFLLGSNRVWEASEPGRTPRTWRVAGNEFCNGTTCVKIIGQQQSDDWDQPRGDSTAWRRRDTLWIAPQLGVAFRVERIIERREPNRRDPTHRLEVHYDLDRRLQYPGKLFDDRRHEIAKALQFRSEEFKLLEQASLDRPRADSLLKRINYHLENFAPTPYRKAIVHLKDQLERAGQGNIALQPTVQETATPVAQMRLGQRVPDFVVSDIVNKDASVRLNSLLGHPVLIAFYNPATETGRQVLEFAKMLKERGPSVSILALAVTNDLDLARRQHAEFKLPFTVLDGHGLHTTLGVEATPRLILLDSDGIARGAYSGWGLQIPGEIQRELQRWSAHEPRP